jgi:hypothetical protein
MWTSAHWFTKFVCFMHLDNHIFWTSFIIKENVFILKSLLMCPSWNFMHVCTQACTECSEIHDTTCWIFIYGVILKSTVCSAADNNIVELQQGITFYKVKCSLYTPWSECSASRPAHFTPGERTVSTHWVGGWGSARASLDLLEMKISCRCHNANSGLSSP